MRGAVPTLLGVLAAAVAATTDLACSDPYTNLQLKEVGDEKAGVPTGEFHRAGQKCVVCHTEGGKSDKHPFVLAGTVFAQPGKSVGLENVKVQITDSAGAKYTATTNCVGNFFIKPGDGFDAKFPLLIRVVRENRSRSMGSQIGRTADCATCHKIGVASDSPEVFSSVLPVYLYTDEEPAPAKSQNCPVDPDLGIERK